MTEEIRELEVVSERLPERPTMVSLPRVFREAGITEQTIVDLVNEVRNAYKVVRVGDELHEVPDFPVLMKLVQYLTEQLGHTVEKNINHRHTALMGFMDLIEMKKFERDVREENERKKSQAVEEDDESYA